MILSSSKRRVALRIGAVLLVLSALVLLSLGAAKGTYLFIAFGDLHDVPSARALADRILEFYYDSIQVHDVIELLWDVAPTPNTNPERMLHNLGFLLTLASLGVAYRMWKASAGVVAEKAPT